MIHVAGSQCTSPAVTSVMAQVRTADATAKIAVAAPWSIANAASRVAAPA